MDSKTYGGKVPNYIFLTKIIDWQTPMPDERDCKKDSWKEFTEACQVEGVQPLPNMVSKPSCPQLNYYKTTIKVKLKTHYFTQPYW